MTPEAFPPWKTSLRVSSVYRKSSAMRLYLLVLPLLILPALPAAADWERLRPETESPPRIQPEADAVCREQARSIDERVLREQAAAGQDNDMQARLWLSEETWAARHRFIRRCFLPRLCLAAGAQAPRLPDGTVTGPYERLLRVCVRQDGQP